MDRKKLEAMLAAGSDNVMLRYALASLLIKQDEPTQAIEHLEIALEQDSAHSASWKLLGKTLAATGQSERAVEVYLQGISIAEARGDIQAAKEMNVFLKRARRDLSAD